MILVTGATGFLGGALISHLTRQGMPVRALVRHPSHRHRLSEPGVDIAVGDVLDRKSLEAALHGVSAVYYLVHAMGHQVREDLPLEQLERQGIENLIAACEARGVRRVIYQGGLAESEEAPSAHLRARFQVERALEESGLEFTVLRAGMILGRGSVSFEVLYRVVRDLPVVPLFAWAREPMEPVALIDLLEVLTWCLTEPRTIGRGFDVGNGERLTYRQLCRQTAEVIGKSPVFLPMPAGGTRLTAIGIVAATRIPLRQALHLAPSLQEALVCREHDIDQIVPGRRQTFREAMAMAAREPARSREPLWLPSELVQTARELPERVLPAGSPRSALEQAPKAVRELMAGLNMLWSPE